MLGEGIRSRVRRRLVGWVMRRREGRMWWMKILCCGVSLDLRIIQGWRTGLLCELFLLRTNLVIVNANENPGPLRSSKST